MALMVIMVIALQDALFRLFQENYKIHHAKGLGRIDLRRQEQAVDPGIGRAAVVDK